MQTASMNIMIQVHGMLAITAATLPNAVVGQAYSFQFSASGGSGIYLWTVTGGALPSGMSLSAGGMLSGAPLVEGAATFEITVTDI